MAENRLKALLSEPEEEEAQSPSRLKGLVEEKPPGFFSDFVTGAKSVNPFSYTEAPNTLGGRMGQVATESAAMAIPMGAAATRIKPVVGEALTIGGKVKNAISSIGNSFRANPAKFTVAEGGLGAASGAGGYYAEQTFPDSDAARFIGEILGGVAPSAIPAAGRGVLKAADKATDLMPMAAATKNYIGNTWNEVARTVNAQTAGSRASERFQRATGGQSPEEIASSMDADILPEAREIMTPAQLSGNPGLLSLEKSVISETDALQNKSAEQLEELNNIIVRSLTGDVSEESAREGIANTQRDYITLLNQRVRLAALKAEERIQKMHPGLGAEQANTHAARELQKALDDAVAQERELFAKIDMDAITPTGNAQAALRELKREVGKAGSDSIPEYVNKFFNPSSKSFLGPLTTVNEMRQAQSRLRNIARNNRVGSDPDFNAARIADKMADAITEDLSLAQGDNPELIADAVNFSRQKNQTFRQGSVGKILRTAADSGDVVPESLTLEASLGLSGPKGAQAFDELINAANTPEMMGAMDSYVKNEFMRAAIRDGEINTTSASTFLRNNAELLDRFPQIKTDIVSAIEAGDALAATENLKKAGIKSFEDPKVSKAALLINKGPVPAFNGVFSARSPKVEMRKLLSLVGDDIEAKEGLQTAFMDYVIDQSTSGDVISGQKMAELLTSKNGIGVTGELFTSDQQKRLYQIMRTAQRVDGARAAKASLEGVTGDKLTGTTDALLGILGAAYGRNVSSNLGGGTVQIPGIFADKFRQLGIQGMVNPAKRLIVDAMQDEDLFKRVLMAKDPENLPEEARRLLNAWAIGAVGHNFEDEE